MKQPLATLVCALALAGGALQAEELNDLGFNAYVKSSFGSGVDYDSYSSVGAVLGAPLGDSDGIGNGFLFLDLRGHYEWEGRYALTSDLGWRVPLDEDGRLLGLHAGYDWRQGDEGDYGWVNLGAELLTEDWDLRLDGYLAPGDQATVQKTIARGYRGNELLLRDQQEKPAWGIEGEARYRSVVGLFDSEPVPYSLAARGYHFASDLDQDNATGFRLGGEVELFDSVTAGGSFSWDTRFGSQGLATLRIAFGDPPGNASQLAAQPWRKRLIEPIVRQELVVLTQGEGELYAFQPADGGTIPFYHVDNTADAGGSGTYEDRFQSLAEAETGTPEGAVIILHRGDGTTAFYDSDFHLKDNQSLLGAGLFDELVFGGVNICFLGNGERPTVTNPLDGNGITLADNTLVQAIDFVQTDLDNRAFPDAGNSIFAAFVRDVTLRDLRVFGDGGPKGPTVDAEDAIHILDFGGTILIEDLLVDSVRDDAVHIDGVSAGGAGQVIVRNAFFNGGEEGFTIRTFNDFRYELEIDSVEVVNSGASTLLPGSGSGSALFIVVNDSSRMDAYVHDSSFHDPASDFSIAGLAFQVAGAGAVADVTFERNFVRGYNQSGLLFGVAGPGDGNGSRLIARDNIISDTSAFPMSPLAPVSIRVFANAPGSGCAVIEGNTTTEHISIATPPTSGPLFYEPLVGNSGPAPELGPNAVAVASGTCVTP